MFSLLTLPLKYNGYKIFCVTWIFFHTRQKPDKIIHGDKYFCFLLSAALHSLLLQNNHNVYGHHAAGINNFIGSDRSVNSCLSLYNHIAVLSSWLSLEVGYFWLIVSENVFFFFFFFFLMCFFFSIK